MRVALYLHFPYCVSRCTYCDFNAYTDAGEDNRSEYIDALCQDIRNTAAERRYRIDTVFCGGGTPSLHSSEQLTRVLDTCRECFDFRPAEVTLEANPGTVTPEQLQDLRQAGFNRISLGVQSFRSGLLETLNRIHSPEQVSQAVSWARAAGFDNLSLDLIYGLPGQLQSDWHSTVEQALELSPDHLSVYQLTVEYGTRLEAQLRLGELTLPDEDQTWRMDRWMRSRLHRAGYRRYEVSNWGRPGRESKHNLVYWKDRPYLGLGCGATGFIDGWRQRRVLHPHAYQRLLARGASPIISAERRDQEGSLRDQLMMGLRTRRGVSFKGLLRRYPNLRLDRLRGFFESQPQEWWQWGRHRLRLSSRGLDFTSSLLQAMLDVQLCQTELLEDPNR